MIALDLLKVGDRSEKLIVTSIVPAIWGSGKRAMVICDCDCGKKNHPVEARKFRSGHTKSCGCKNNRRKGESRSPEFRAWSGMMKRCYDPKNNSFPDYGGRGIKVCKRWQAFENFLADMGRKTTPLHSLGRKNNNKGYSLKNCRWENREQQANNTRKNRFLTIDGEKLTISQAARKYKIRPGTIWNRLDLSWSEEDAVKIAVRVWNPRP